MPNERIELTDSPLSSMIKLSEGNPGAITVLTQLYKTGPIIDPDAILGGLAHLLSLDTLNIYGSRIWMLYKDVCKEDIVYTHAVLRACQLGIISRTSLQSAIDGVQKLDLNNILEAVREKLPAFGNTDLRATLLAEASNEL
jgi:hypothetical protein